MNFGAAFYCKHDLSARPELVITLLRLLGEPSNTSVYFQGMLARSDKFTRAMRLTSKSEVQLRVDIGGGVYSDIVAFLGQRPDPVSSVSIAFPADRSSCTGHLGTLYLTVAPSSASAAPHAVALSARAWSLAEPAYGLSVWGRTFPDVFSEIHMTPIADWRASPDPGNESRLLGLQRRRQMIGAYARSAAWGTYLGGHLLEALGGFDAIQRSAPVTKVCSIPRGGAYLQLASDPLFLGTPEYEAAASRLEEFLRPILLPE